MTQDEFLKLKDGLDADTMLFVRQGDFYDLYFEDAEIAAKILKITICKTRNGFPVCAIPYYLFD